MQCDLGLTFCSDFMLLYFDFFTVLQLSFLTLLHPEWPKLYGVLAVLSAIGLKKLNGTEVQLRAGLFDNIKVGT